jgi:hypothetical protein
MTIPSDKITELRVKHLEMIQAIISRVANKGATLKNYCLTLVTAICGLAVSLQRPLAAAMAFLPVVIFALLDDQYLRVERRFRHLFRSGSTRGLVDDADVPDRLGTRSARESSPAASRSSRQHKSAPTAPLT